MRVLLLNQTFHPDVMATAQYLTDLALELHSRGHQVTVVTSRRAYDDPDTLFPAGQDWRGIRIWRVGSTRFGKRAKWRRAADFASFLLNCCWRLVRLPRQDITIALTSPPLISWIGAWFTRLRGGRFCYWVMDLNPDEAVAAGWLRSDSLLTRLLESLSRFSLRAAAPAVVLDRFMRDRVLAKGIAPENVSVISPWSQDGVVRFDSDGRERFRRAHGLADKFVVMHAGNHSPCHPLGTLLAAARQLRDHPEIVFCFQGGGSELARVRAFAAAERLVNIICLPYQPLADLAGALSAADLHVVVMGEPFVGTIHPCKIYNALAVGAPILYLGPAESHVQDMLQDALRPDVHLAVRHGQVQQLTDGVLRLSRAARRLTAEELARTAALHSRASLLPRLVGAVEQTAPN